MKHVITTIAIASAFCTASYAQSAATMETESVTITAKLPANKQLFKAMKLVSYQNYANLKFTVAKVQNVSKYRIEAGNDSTSLETIAQINQPLNATIPTKFDYVLHNQLKDYKYYRVVQVAMNQELEYSNVLVNTPQSQMELAVNQK